MPELVALKGSANERLRGALIDANVTIQGLADRLGVDVKSVERWITNDRTPHARNAYAAAKILGADAHHLWPKLGERHRSTPTPQDEVVACYPMRSTVPHGLWRTTLAGATSVIDLAVANLLFLADAVWDLPALLADKAASGVRVRVVTLDNPAGPVTGIADVFPSVADVPGVRLATHRGLRADVFRADDDLLVTTPVDGLTPTLAPVLHLRRLGPAPMAGGYLATLDHLFATATPARPVSHLRAVVA